MIELSRWISRALQYSPKHPLSAQLAVRTHEIVTRALREWTPLEVGVLRDKMTIGQTPARHPALVTRLAPYLHERGVRSFGSPTASAPTSSRPSSRSSPRPRPRSFLRAGCAPC